MGEPSTGVTWSPGSPTLRHSPWVRLRSRSESKASGAIDTHRPYVSHHDVPDLRTRVISRPYWPRRPPERKPRASTGGAGSVLSIAVTTQTERHVVKGAVLGENTPRLLHVDGIDIEAPLEQNLIYMRNQDVPGVIGKVGTILGKHGINIANFSLGRRTGAASSGIPQEAIAVVHVDGGVPEAVVSELRGVPAVEQAQSVRLD